MRVVLEKKESGRIEHGIIFGGIALLALVAVRLLPLSSYAPACVFRHLTGIPCPTCGATRSMVFLAYGDIASAFTMNPLVAAGILLALFSFFYGSLTLLFDLPRIRVLLTEEERGAARWSSAVLLLVEWIYLIKTLS